MKKKIILISHRIEDWNRTNFFFPFSFAWNFSYPTFLFFLLVICFDLIFTSVICHISKIRQLLMKLFRIERNWITESFLQKTYFITWNFSEMVTNEYSDIRPTLLSRLKKFSLTCQIFLKILPFQCTLKSSIIW